MWRHARRAARATAERGGPARGRGVAGVAEGDDMSKNGIDALIAEVLRLDACRRKATLRMGDSDALMRAAPVLAREVQRLRARVAEVEKERAPLLDETSRRIHHFMDRLFRVIPLRCPDKLGALYFLA